MLRSALAVVIVAASSSAAFAGGYVGLGIGTSPAISDVGTLELHENGRSGRLQLGYRFGHFAVEGLGTRADLVSQRGTPVQWQSLGIAGKLNLDLGDHFEIYGRFGVQKTDLDLEASDDDYSGDGLFGGIGFEYRLTVGGVGLGAVIDYTVSRSDLTGEVRAGSWETTSRAWTLGGIAYF